jgi:Zn-dependent protease
MGKDIPLGRIAGIRVGLDVSAFLMAGLLAVLLATVWFPHVQPGQGTTAYWIAGAGGAFLLFFSLLVHEIGHALVAKDEGIGVDSMSLNILGGVTRMESSPTTPGAEFRIAVVGPIASAACGLVFLVGSFLLPDGGLIGLTGDLFFWTGRIGLFLALLNMIPGAPLDGGKVLTSIVWRGTGDQSTALLWSGAAGVVVGMGLATYGYRSLDDPRVGNLGWGTVLVGLFIVYAAIQQIRSAPLYRTLDGLTVANAMAADPPTAPSWATVGEFLRTSSPRPEHQAYPVVGADGVVVGLLTAAAIRAVPPHERDRLPVMTLAYPLDRLTVLRAEEGLIPAAQKVESGDVRNALVVAEDGRIVGTLDLAGLDRVVAEQTSLRKLQQPPGAFARRV